MEYTVGTVGIKILSSESIAKSISIIRKYNPLSMGEIKSTIEKNEYVLISTIIDHSGVKKVAKCYDELLKNGIETQLFERDKPIDRDLITNLMNSHRQTDMEVQAQVDSEVLADYEE